MTNIDPKIDRRQEILVGAFSALMKNGLPALSFEAIAEEAGVSRQLVRYHFSDNEGLMIALCDLLAARYRDMLINGMMKVEGGNRLDVFLDYYFDLLDGAPKPRDDQAYDALMSLSARYPKVKENLRNGYTLLGQVVSHEIELSSPSLGSQASQELSYLFVALMYGHWKMVASLGLAEDHKMITRKAIDRLIQSYLNDEGETGPPVAVWRQEPEA